VKKETRGVKRVREKGEYGKQIPLNLNRLPVRRRPGNTSKGAEKLKTNELFHPKGEAMR